MSDLTGLLFPALDLWQIAVDGTVVAENLLGEETGVGITAYEGLGLPAQRTADVDLPNDHGVRALGDFHQARALTFVLCIYGDGCDPATRAADAWVQLRKVAAVWQARRADVVLELCMTDGTTYVLVGRPRRFEADTARLRRGYVSVATEFLATDPRMYAPAESFVTATYDIAQDQGGFCLTDTPNGGGPAQVICLTDTPNGAGAGQVLCLEPRTTGTATIDNVGNTDTYPTTTFFAPAVNPQVINATTDRTLGFVVTLAGADVLVVNHRTRVVTLNGTSAPSLLGPAADFWPLVPGLNEVHFVHAGGTPAVATLTWRPAWVREVSMAVRSTPLWIAAGCYSDVDLRAYHALLDTPCPAGGVRYVTGTEMAVTAPGGMSVAVAVGTAWVPGTDAAGQGMYLVDNPTSTTATIAANGSGNPRIDRIVADVNDPAFTGTGTAVFTLAVVQGTPAGSPVAPTVPPSAIPLARVAVANGAASITTGNITDERVFCPLIAQSAITQPAIPRAEVAREAAVVINNAIAPGVSITFDTTTTDTSAFHSGATFTVLTIPAGLGGIYSISARAAFGLAFNGWFLFLTAGGNTTLIAEDRTGQVAEIGGTIVRPLAAGNTVALNISQIAGGTPSLDYARLSLVRLGA